MSEDNPNIAAPESTGRDPNQAEEFVPGPLDDASRADDADESFEDVDDEIDDEEEDEEEKEIEGGM